MDFGNQAGHSLGDSDGNGLADWWDILYFGALGNDPNQVLANKGGLTLQDAFDNDLDLTESSTVRDEIPDAWKVQHGLDPLDPDLGNQDPEGDGLTNGDEYDSGADPMAWDSDGDYIADGSDLYPMVADPSAPPNFRVTVPSWDEQYESQEPDWSAVDYTSIELKWEASSNGASSYKIERREDNDIWHQIATVSGTSHPDTSLVANRHYQYRIWAIKNSGGTEVVSPAATANYQVPLALRMHVKTASVSQWEQGFTEFTSPSTPRKYYLTKPTPHPSLEAVRGPGRTRVAPPTRVATIPTPAPTCLPSRNGAMQVPIRRHTTRTAPTDRTTTPPQVLPPAATTPLIKVGAAHR